MSDLQYTQASDQQILQDLGRRLHALRRARGLTQGEAAARARLSRNTLYRAEQGDNPTLHTVIRLLRTYGQIADLESFIPAVEISPMARLRARRAADD